MNDVVVVAAVGNRAEGYTRTPASCPGVVTVGAVDQQWRVWEDSHRSEFVDVVAPGVGLDVIEPGGVVRQSPGTSLASALVSGVVALLRAEFPQASADEIVTRLVATTQDVGDTGWDEASGHGLVRPLTALTADVPADAPNPVFAPLGDLDALTPAEDDESESEDPVQIPQADEDEGGVSWLVLGLGGAVMVALAAAGTVGLVRGRRGRGNPPAGEYPG